MQAANNNGLSSVRAGSASKSKEFTTATYKTTFSSKDMSVNQKYARYLERFGSTQKLADDKSQTTQNESDAQQQHTLSNTRREENKVDSRSPEMDDMMMESTGMQRSSAKLSPPTDDTARTNQYQRRVQDLSQQLTQAANFKGSFQRFPNVPLPHDQPDQPRLSTRPQNESPRQIESKSVPAQLDLLRKSPTEEQTSTTSQSRLKIKLADYLSPNAAVASHKLGAQALNIKQKSPKSGANALSKIKRREHARKLYSVLQSNWVPTLERVKADAFECIKDEGQVIRVENLTVGPKVETYASIQSFGVLTNENTQGIIDTANYQTTLSEQTADFNSELVIQQKPPLPESARNGDKRQDKLSLIKKQKYMIDKKSPDTNWRSTTPRAVVSPDSEPDQKFDFKELENLQQTKYQQLAQLNPLQSSTESMDKYQSMPNSNQTDSDKSIEFQDQKDLKQEPICEPSIEEQEPWLVQGVQPDSLDSYELKPPKVSSKETKPMLSPLQNPRGGYQYPKAEMNAIYPPRKQSYMQASTPHLRNTSEGFNEKLGLHPELGEAPVSVHPTEFTQTNDSQSQLMQISQSESKHMMNDANHSSFKNQLFSDNKTTRQINRSPPPTLDKSDEGLENNHAEKDIDQNSSGLGPMKLEFLQEDPSTHPKLSNKQTNLSEPLDTQKHEQTSEYTSSLKTSQIAQSGKDLVSAILQGQNPVTMSADNEKYRRIEAVKPLMSIFSGDMLDRANRVNAEVSEKIAKIKAMQEQILRPRSSKSNKSVRSGRQMSDQDYEKVSRELGYTVNVHQVTQSDVGSERDRSIDFGEINPQTISNPATIEYFSQEYVPKHTRKASGSQLQHSAKRSADFNRSGLGSMVGAEIHSPDLQRSVDMKQISSPASYIDTLPQIVDERETQEANQFVINSEINEIKQLKVQNKILIISNKLSQRENVTKQVFLTRWRQKLQKQWKVLSKLTEVFQKQQQESKIQTLRQSFNSWRAFKEMAAQGAMQEAIWSELNAVQTITKNLLINIQKSFTEKRQQRIQTRYFNAFCEAYKLKMAKKQGCQRLERALRRLLRKRQRNFFKALTQQPFVSDLADEEVFSLMSGTIASSSAMAAVRQFNQSPAPHERSASANLVVSPRNITPNGSRVSQSHNSMNVDYNAQQKIEKIQLGLKIVTISVRRQVKQNQQPSVQELFHFWKLRVRCMAKGEALQQLVITNRNSIPYTEEYSSMPYERNGKSTQPVSSKNTVIETRNSEIFEGQQQHLARGLESIISSVSHKQASFANQPTKSIDEVYSPSSQRSGPKYMSATPEHEMRADMLTMLENPRPSQVSDATSNLQQQQQQHQEQILEVSNQDMKEDKDIVTTSDISSVELDSDDSCFATTVEIIKLAPVKKNKESTATRLREQRMPSTTNVSQIDQQDPSNASPGRPDFQSVSDDKNQPCLINMIATETTKNLEQQPDYQNYTRSPPIDALSDKRAREEPEQNVRPQKKLKPFRPQFTKMALEERSSIPGPNPQQTQKTSRQLHTSPQQKRVKSRSTNKSDPSLKQSAYQTSTIKKVHHLNYFSNKSNSVALSSKQISQSSDTFKKEIETPQFRQSLISNRQKSTNSIKAEEANYYEMADRQLHRLQRQSNQKQRESKQSLPKVTKAEREKQKLIQQLAKVAEAQIAAEVVQHEEMEKEKKRKLTKELERKTNLIFQKKNLRGMPNAPVSFPVQTNHVSSQVLANIKPQFSEFSNPKHSNSVSKKQKSLSRNRSIKGSFVSQQHIRPSQLPPMVYQNPNSRSQIASPKRRTISQQQKAKVHSTTTRVSPDKTRLIKVDVQACLSNALRVKMPDGTFQSSALMAPQAKTSRTSDLTQGSQHNLYSQMARNPFQENKKKRASSNMKRSGSKNSLRSISDRPLKTTYVPPVYKSRAFRSRRRNSNSDLGEKDQGNFCSTSQFIMADGTQMTLPSDMAFATAPQIEIDENNFQALGGQSPDTEFRQTTEIVGQFDMYKQQMMQSEEVQQEMENQTNIVVTQQHEDQPEYQEEFQPEDQQEYQQEFQPEDQSAHAYDIQMSNQIQVENMDPSPRQEQQISELEIADLQQQDEQHQLQQHQMQQNIDDQNQYYTQPKVHENEDTPNSAQIYTRNYQETPEWIAQSIQRKQTNQSAQSVSQTKQQDTENTVNLQEEHKIANIRWQSQKNVLGQQDSIQQVAQEQSERRGSDDVQSSVQTANFNRVDFTKIQAQMDQERRLTFGRQEQASPQREAIIQEEEQNPMQYLLEDEEAIARIDEGFSRLCNAISPRLERYKVELFIHMCEALESEEDDQNQQESGASQHQDQISSEEDVYGSGTYLRPKDLGGVDQFDQYYK